MEDFDKYLKDDSDAQEREAADQVREGLKGLRLENKIAAIAVERRQLLRSRLLRRILFVAAIILTCAVILFLFVKDTPSVFPQHNNQDLYKMPDDPPSIIPDTPSNTTPGRKEKVPMADNRQTGNALTPRFPAPNIRGEKRDDKAWKDLLNKLWYTEYPAANLTLPQVFQKADQMLVSRDFNGAYVQLQKLERNLPPNDTLRYLKGYCLMEMGEGAEALTYFDKLEVMHPEWTMNLQWFRGLSRLLTGDKEQALKTFREISATPRHTYRDQSKYAIQLLE